MRKLACPAGIILDSRGGGGIRSHWKESPEIPVRSNSEGHGPALRNADSRPDDEFELRGVLHFDAEVAVLTRHTDSTGNHKEWRFVLNERYSGLQPEGPIHGYLFRGDAARSSGYPCRLDKSCNGSGQLSPE